MCFVIVIGLFAPELCFFLLPLSMGADVWDRSRLYVFNDESWVYPTWKNKVWLTLYIYIYIYICTHMCVYIYIYIYAHSHVYAPDQVSNLARLVMVSHIVVAVVIITVIMIMVIIIKMG